MYVCVRVCAVCVCGAVCVLRGQGWLAEVESRLAEKGDPHRRQGGLYDSQATTPVTNNQIGRAHV